MNRFAIRLLRLVLGLLLLGSVLAQLLVPVFASEEATIFPEVAHLAGAYAVAVILIIACGQVALLAIWRLLSLIDSRVIFTRRALRWVDLIIACGAVATILATGGLVHLLFVVGTGGPLVLWLPACLASGLAFVLLMVVMRGLLESAIADRTELDEVI
jgi:hypothetical protein